MRFACSLATAAAAVGALLVGAPTAAAEPCPDVEVVFARGTGEPPGPGGVGQVFVDQLRAQAPEKSVGVYPVNYGASFDFFNRSAFASNVVDGIRDARAHVQTMAANCPATKLVLGGYSQGALVAGFATSAQELALVPGDDAENLAPMPPAVADHVAAVTLFGLPSAEFLRENAAPPVIIGPRYADKTIEQCAIGDTFCSGAPGGGVNLAHGTYVDNGMVSEAATFAAGRL